MKMCVLCQFSDQNADDMRKTYAEFCSRHLKAVKLYKELLTRDKKFQSFIRVRTNQRSSSRMNAVRLSAPDGGDALQIGNLRGCEGRDW